MTVVAAYYDGKTYSMSTDSAGVSGHLTIHRLSAKIINKGQYCIGFTHSYRSADLIKESKDTPEAIRNINDVRKLRDEIRKTFINAGALKITSEDYNMPKHPLTIIIMSERGLWGIEADYQVYRISDYHAVGSGREFAFGVLAAAKQLKVDSATATQLAVKAAIKHCTTCGGRCYTTTISK